MVENPFSVNESIELHDSELATVYFSDGTAVVTLSSAYVHQSSGVPGVDSGLGWYQCATLKFAGAPPVPVPANLPVGISDGFLRIGDRMHDHLIPACGKFEDAIEFSILISTQETLTIRGSGITIELHGEPSGLERYKS